MIPASGTCWPGIPPRSWSLPDRPTRAWLTALRAWAGDGSVAARPLLAGLTRELFVREGLAGTQVELLDAEGIDGFPPMPDGAGADLLGLAHEALLAPADRKARGAHYTPPALADRLVALSLPPTAAAVLDPACGGGAFLLAAGRALVARGRPAGEAVRCLHGIDVDPLTVDVARAATALWSGGAPAAVTVGDFLVLARTDGFDAVIGNPPFASPLRVTTSRSGSSPGAYTDTAGLFLLRALDLLRPDGRVGLIQPQSVLTSRDADGVRAAVEARAALRALWVAEERVFAASTHVVAVIAEKGGAAGPVDLYGGPSVEPRGRASGSWGTLAARARGLPAVDLGEGPTVGSIATATAGFRHQFYGLLDHVTEDGPGRPLVTAGLIDPLHCAWGERTTRIGGKAWTRPTVDIEALGPDLRAWFAARLVPKLLIASQTKVVEAVADEAGALLPSVPVVSVEAPVERLWDLAAALSSPPVTAWCVERSLGSGLSADAVRLSARLLLEVPLPPDRRAWTRATAALRSAAVIEDPAGRHRALVDFGRLGCRAYRVGVGGVDGLLAWWSRRLPRP
jgi:SAM-dependent methyltransferase